MYSSNLISLLIIATSIYIVVVSARLLVKIAKGADAHRFFRKPHGSSCDRFGRKGISLLCRDTGDEHRLRNLLAVEYSEYEVVIVADSLRNYHSLQRIIYNYRMVAVDGRMSSDRHLPAVRRMYRSASRCYRRLLLLDVATTGKRSDLDAAFDVATYDYLLPLWGSECLLPGTIERLAAEVCTSDSDLRVVKSCVGAPLTLFSRVAATDADGVSRATADKRYSRNLYEPLAAGGSSRSIAGRLIATAIIALVALCTLAAMADIAPLDMGVTALTMLFVAVAAYAASTIISHREEGSVGYGDTLYLFCENLLPRIWQIRK